MPSKLQTTLRVVFPAALSGIVASIVLGFSRAVGETMVVVIAAGLSPQWGADPLKAMETMTAFIASTAKGDIATGSDRLQDHLRRRNHALRDHPDHEPDLDPFRSQVSAGVRVSTDTASRRTGIGLATHKGSASRLGLFTCLGLTIAMLVVLLVDMPRTAPDHLTWSFITSFSSINADQSGIQAALWGTIWLMGVCALFIVPVGVATAIYLEEYADSTKWFNRLIELNIQNLAAVPSIVYGILGLAFLVRGPLSLGPVILAGGLTLGLLVLPVVIIAGREAIRAVPPSIREGSMALGATQWQTIWKQVLPAAIPGIATGVILALARAIGETAPLIVVGAATFIAFNPTGLDSDFTAMPIQIFDWISRPSNDVNDYRPLAAAGILLLMILLLAMNSVAIWLRNRYEQKW